MAPTSFRCAPRPLLKALALALPLLALHGAQAQTTTSPFKPKVLHRFSTTDANAPGSLPEFPPIVGQDGMLYGTTRIGGPLLNTVLPQGVAYRIDPASSTPSYTAKLLGDIAMPTTNLVLASDGTIYGGTGTSNVNNTSQFGVTPAAYTIKAGTPAVWFQPSNGPRGQIAIDDQNRLFVGGANTVTTCSATARTPLWRLNPDGTETKVLDFCNFATGEGLTQLQPKGGMPVSTLWSKADQALYVLTWNQARGVFDATNTADSAGRSFGTLVKISKAALDAGAAAGGVMAADQVQVLHTFLRQRDGEPTASGGRMTGMVEAGDWIYGISYSNPITGGVVNSEIYGGTLWRVKKSEPGSFAIVHRFRDTAEQAKDNTPQADGNTPSGSLVLAADGNIYGTTSRDGSTINVLRTTRTAIGAGTLYRVVPGTRADRTDDKYEVLHRFDLATDGGRPLGLSAGPVKAGVQRLYGATSYGGNGETVDVNNLSVGGNGTVFSIDLTLPTASFTTTLAASATTAKVGDRITLSWATSNTARCTASGDNGSLFSGAQQTTASALPLTAALSKVGANTFILSCDSLNDGPAIQQTVTVTVEALPAPSSGGGSLAAALLAPLAGLAGLGLRGRSRRRA